MCLKTHVWPMMHKYKCINMHLYSCEYLCIFMSSAFMSLMLAHVYIHMYMRRHMYICVLGIQEPHVGLYIYMHVYICIHISVYVYECNNVFMYMHANISVCMNMYSHISWVKTQHRARRGDRHTWASCRRICIHIHMYIYKNIYVYSLISVCIYMQQCVYVCICMNLYSHSSVCMMDDCFYYVNSNLAPLLQGLCSSNPCRFDVSIFDFLPVYIFTYMWI